MNDTTAPAPTDADKNPFLSNAGIKGLLENLRSQNRLAGLDPRRLEAIERQAANIHDDMLSDMAALGKLSAHAAETGEVSDNTWINIGWLTAFLSELASLCDLYASNARFELEGGLAAAEAREEKREHAETGKNRKMSH